MRVFLTLILFLNSMTPISAQLIPVATSNEVWNGVTTSADGRIFVCFPRIEGEQGIRIGEIKEGNIIPYPDKDWNDWEPGIAVNNKFVRTNSLRIGPDGHLWIVDTGTPKMGEKALKNAAKLVEIDISQNKVIRTIPLNRIMQENSFIDDLRIAGNTIYLTDAGAPGLAIMDKTTGTGRRVLENAHATTDHIPLIAEGKVMQTTDGQELRIHADQLEVSPDGQFLYFQPASGPLYRIATKYLIDAQLSAQELERHVTTWFETPTTGGTAMDADGNLYVSDVNHSAILKINPEGQQEQLILDPRLLWGDALWIDDAGYLWIPVGQLNRLGAFQNGRSLVEKPLVIYKMQINARPFRS